ncbi:MAG: hypothetical protein IKS35_04140 [Clostridia bacterium]|nr:hypothetical protein [Clostridia bacterium]
MNMENARLSENCSGECIRSCMVVRTGWIEPAA